MLLQPFPRLRCAGVATGATGLAATAARVLAGQLDDSVATADEALVQGCVLALLGCLAWGWAVTYAVVVEAWRGAGAPLAGVPLGSPLGVRRLLLAACGVALAGALAAPGHASPGHQHPGADRDGSLAGLPMPERAVGSAHPSSSSPPVTVGPDAERVVVRPGDSLWLIAARALPPGASAATITASWHQLYRTNRAVIGSDPDLIHPGQLLRRPPVPSS